MRLEDADGRLQLTQALSLGEIGWVPDSGNDQLFGGAGNDRLIGGNGHNLLDGGDGFDLVEFVGRVADYTLGLEESTPGMIDLVLKNTLSGSSNILRNVELTKFGGVFYTLQIGVPDPELDNFKPLTDFVRVVGVEEALAAGALASWV
jgi:hypothetical protein